MDTRWRRNSNFGLDFQANIEDNKLDKTVPPASCRHCYRVGRAHQIKIVPSKAIQKANR